MFRFYKNRRKFFLFSGCIFAIAIVFGFINGVNLDIQFKGGAIIKYSYNGGDVNTGDVARVVSETLGNKALPTVQTTEIAASDSTDRYKLVINMAGNISAEDQRRLNDALAENFPSLDIRDPETSSVDPFIGARFIRSCLIAIGLGFLLIVIYVWFAFRKIGGLSAGVMAILALLHDVAIVFSTFVIFNIPINESFVVAALTIIGFSVNDTIVIYDRVRENSLIYGTKLSTEELVDKSINQSLSRAINTSIVVAVSLLVILILTEINGVTSMRSFTLPMLFGTAFGCYSSLCIAGPLWVSWKNHKAKKAAVTAK